MNESGNLTPEEWTRAWLKKARHDIEGARQLLNADEPLADLICFHAQQCAEKCLKGFLTAQGVAVEKTHDLTALLDACVPYNAALGAFREDCERLNDYAVEVRYPGDVGEPSAEEARAAVEAAAAIRRFVLAALGEPDEDAEP